MSTALGYTYLTQYNARRFTNTKRTVKGITIHHWGSLGSDFLGIVGWFCNSNTTAMTSAHYAVQGADANGTVNKRVACMVDPDVIAWHAGDWQANVDTIGIECRPEARDVDYQVIAELVARLWVTYGVVPLYPHRHWVTTECPGRYAVDFDRIKRESTVKYRELTSITPPSPPPPPKDTFLMALTDAQQQNIFAASERIMGRDQQRFKSADGKTVDQTRTSGDSVVRSSDVEDIVNARGVVTSYVHDTGANSETRRDAKLDELLAKFTAQTAAVEAKLDAVLTALGTKP